MFETYVFTEMPYPHTPPMDSVDAVKVTLPNSIYDPDAGSHLFHKYFDIFQAADALGLGIMINEHHESAASVTPSVNLNLAIIARETKQVPLLALGTPIGNRPDPIRVAEEFLVIDVISEGRLEVGFVRGSPEEILATNTNPVYQRERFWEAADLIEKAWTTHDGPFNWEGRHFHHRQVNIWPRPYRQPHPPIWMTTLNASSVPDIADRGYRVATIINGKAGCKPIFDAYRRRWGELGREGPCYDRLAYSGAVFVGDSDDEAYEEAKKLQWHYRHVEQPLQFIDIPGYVSASARARAMHSANAEATEDEAPDAGFQKLWAGIHVLGRAPIEQLAADGFFFAGTPDTVFGQLRDFFNAVGGFGHFSMSVQSKNMSCGKTVASMERFARDVLPRFQEEVFAPFVSRGGLVEGRLQ